MKTNVNNYKKVKSCHALDDGPVVGLGGCFVRLRLVLFCHYILVI